MRTIDLYHAFHAVDDDILERSEAAIGRRKKNGWLKWGVAAACLCLVIVSVITTFHEQRTSPPVYGVLAEVTEVLSEHQFEAIITGEDVNFSENEVVTVTYEDVGEIAIAIGDTVAITYSEFEKSDLSYKISAGQIEIVSLMGLPGKGSAPTEYPDTTIVPGFDLNEPDTP